MSKYYLNHMFISSNEHNVKVYSPRLLFDITSMIIIKLLTTKIIKRQGDHFLSVNHRELDSLRNYVGYVVKTCQIRHERNCKDVKEILSEIIRRCARSEDYKGVIFDNMIILLPFIWSGIECHIATKSYDNIFVAMQRRNIKNNLSKKFKKQIYQRSCSSSKNLKQHYKNILSLYHIMGNRTINRYRDPLGLVVETTRRRVKMIRRKSLNLVKRISDYSIIQFARYLDVLEYSSILHHTSKGHLYFRYGRTTVKDKSHYLSSRELNIIDYKPTLYRTDPTTLTWQIILTAGSYKFDFRSNIGQQNFTKCSRSNY